jgi:hypothetical protein
MTGPAASGVVDETVVHDMDLAALFAQPTLGCGPYSVFVTCTAR